MALKSYASWGARRVHTEGLRTSRVCCLRRARGRMFLARNTASAEASTAEVSRQHNYYKILGVSRGATEKEIKRAYRAKAKKLHPDVNDGQDTTDEFKLVKEAADVLMDPAKRARYDRELDSYVQEGRRYSARYAGEKEGQDTGVGPTEGMWSRPRSRPGTRRRRSGRLFDEELDPEEYEERMQEIRREERRRKRRDGQRARWGAGKGRGREAVRIEPHAPWRDLETEEQQMRRRAEERREMARRKSRHHEYAC